VTYPGNGDTYLYRQDGAPYELIRQTTSAGACGAATCRYWYLLDGRRSVVDHYHYVTTRRVPGRAEHRRGGRRLSGLRRSERPVLTRASGLTGGVGAPRRRAAAHATPG